jgi:hypothetical protein
MIAPTSDRLEIWPLCGDVDTFLRMIFGLKDWKLLEAFIPIMLQKDYLYPLHECIHDQRGQDREAALDILIRNGVSTRVIKKHAWQRKQIASEADRLLDAVLLPCLMRVMLGYYPGVF